MFNVLDNARFDILKERTTRVLGTTDALDERMKPSLIKLNTLPGIATVWSCSGHTEEECKAKNKTYNEYQERYVIFVIDESGWEILESFSEWSKQLRKEYWMYFRPRLTTGELVWKLDDDRLISSNRQRYPFWEITMSYPDVSNESREVLEEMWVDMINYLCRKTVK